LVLSLFWTPPADSLKKTSAFTGYVKITFFFPSPSLFSYHRLCPGTPSDTNYAWRPLTMTARINLLPASCPPRSYISNIDIFHHYSSFSQ
jgi:hypothetical protein